MHITSASTSTVPTDDSALGMFPVTLVIIEMGGMDGDITTIQGMLAELKSEVGKVGSGSMTVSVTVVEGKKIVLMGTYRNAGVAYDEAVSVLKKHGVAVDEGLELTGNPYGDDRYQPGTYGQLPSRVKTASAATTDSASAE